MDLKIITHNNFMVKVLTEMFCNLSNNYLQSPWMATEKPPQLIMAVQLCQDCQSRNKEDFTIVIIA